MSTIKGQNLRITLGGKCVAFATACTVHVAAQMEESSTKDSTNDWTEQTVTGLSWDISVDALYSMDTDSTGVNGVDALDIVLAREKVLVEFTQTEGTQNREEVSGTAVYSGYAWVNDMSINATNRQNTSYSLQATGDGALTKSTSSSSSL